jgi:hypothetical protein
MRILTRQATSQRTRPTGNTIEELAAAVWQSIEEVWAAVERLESNSLMRFEPITLSGDWAAVSGAQGPSAKSICPDTIVLRGRVENPTGAAHTTQIGTLPPALRPRYETKSAALAIDSAAAVIPIILTIATDGDITPTWAAAPTGSFQLLLDNILVHLA